MRSIDAPRRHDPRWSAALTMLAAGVVILVEDLAKDIVVEHDVETRVLWSGPSAIRRRLVWRAMTLDDPRRRRPAI